MSEHLIVIAGATGNLGGRIAAELRALDVQVRALVRQQSSGDRIARLRDMGVEVIEVDFSDKASLAEVCRGATCVVSALAGLRDVIVDAQSQLLNAAVEAGVPRFVPSDFSIDFTKLLPGTNRNLDLRREFKQTLDAAAIGATTVFNGAFTDMLTGQAPIVLFRFNRILYWGDAEQVMDFTTIDDTAWFTARAAIDESAPRFLRIAGDEINARGLAAAVSEATGNSFRTFRPGGLRLLGIVIKIVRAIFPAPSELYPPWQGMQYLQNMFEGRAKLTPLDNDRYGQKSWTTAKDVLTLYYKNTH